MVDDIYRYHELSMWPGTRGLKGLGCKVKDGPTHPKSTPEGWPFTAVPYPQAGGQTAVAPPLKQQYTRPLSKRSTRVHCNASSGIRIAQQNTG